MSIFSETITIKHGLKSETTFRIYVSLDQQVHKPHGQVVQPGQPLVLVMLRTAVIRGIFHKLGVVGTVKVQDVVQRFVQIVADSVDPRSEASVCHFGCQRHGCQGKKEAEQIDSSAIK